MDAQNNTDTPSSSGVVQPQVPVQQEAPQQAEGQVYDPEVPVAQPVAQTETVAPVVDGDEKSGFPLKIVLIILGALVLLGVIGFAVKTFLLKPPIPVQTNVTLTYWGLWEDSSTIDGLIQEYESTHKNVTINYVKQSKEDYRERLINNLARGEGPDIFRFHNTWVPMLSTSLAALPPEVMDAGTFQNTFYPVASQDLRQGTNLVGIPLMFDGLGLYINEDIFTSAGKNPPTTWDELSRTAGELTKKDADGRITQAGVAMGRTDNVDHWEDILALMMLQNGVSLGAPTGKSAEDVFSFFTVFAKQGGVWDKTLPPSTQAFASGNLAMYFGPSWRALEIKQTNPGLRFRVVPVPQLPKVNPTDKDITWASYWAEGVWNKSKNSKEAWEFLKFLSQKESLQKIYETSSKSRLFGPAYPRVDMANLLQNDPILGAYISRAPHARSWYLASRTFDGPTGMNSRLSAYFADSVNAIVDQGKEPKEVLETLSAGVAQVLSSYSVAR